MTLALVIVILLAAQAARAEEGAIRVLTLSDALTIAMDQNRDILKAREYQKWMRGKYIEERAGALPQASLTVYGTHAYDDSQQELFGDFADIFPTSQNIFAGQVNVSQPVYTWGKVGAAIRAARFGFEVADDQLRQFQQAVRRDVTASFYGILLAKELDRIAKQNLDQKKRHLEEAQKKYTLGVATDYDVLAARVAVDNARPEAIRSENLVRVARERLKFMLAEQKNDLDVTGSLEAEISPVPDYGTALSTAYQNRPDLSDLEHKTAVYRELIKITNAGDKPRVDFNASYGARRFLVGDIDSKGRLWSAGLALSFPFFDGMRTRGQVMQTRSDMTTLQIETLKFKDSIALELQIALDAVNESTEILKALAGTVEQAERLLQMAEKGYEFGVKTKLEVDDAQLNLNSARGNLARARREYLVARVNLEWFMGILGESEKAAAPVTPKSKHTSLESPIKAGADSVPEWDASSR
jgi:HAE1 family hydrophobic/amphiphilic exporter-1